MTRSQSPFRHIVTRRLLAAGLATLLGAASASALAPKVCIPDAVTLCLFDQQFGVTVTYDDDKTMGASGEVISGAEEFGFFDLDADGHLDLFVRILDACSFTSSYWVELIGLSNLAQSVSITEDDVVVATYDNAAGSFYGIFDTGGIACSAAPFMEPDEEIAPPRRPRAAPSQPTMTIDRFEITIDWEAVTTDTGVGNPVEVSDRSGYFWYFASTAPDLVLKMVDRSAENGNIWLTFGASGTYGFDLEVKDLCDGSVTTFVHPVGATHGTTVDSTSFSASPSCLLFFDGFESGDVMEWTDSAP